MRPAGLAASPSVEFKFSSLFVSSSKTLLLERSLCTIGEGCVGFKSKLNLFKDEAVEAEEAPEVALEGGAISALLGTEALDDDAAEEASFAIGTEAGAAAVEAVASGVAETGVAGVC